MSVLDSRFLLHFGIPTDVSFADVALLEARWRGSDRETFIADNLSDEFSSTISSAIEFPRTPCAVRFEENIERRSSSSGGVSCVYDFQPSSGSLSHSNISWTRFEDEEDDDTTADFSRLSLKPFGEIENKEPLLKRSPDFFELSAIGKCHDDSRGFDDSIMLSPSIVRLSIS